MNEAIAYLQDRMLTCDCFVPCNDMEIIIRQKPNCA